MFNISIAIAWKKKENSTSKNDIYLHAVNTLEKFQSFKNDWNSSSSKLYYTSYKTVFSNKLKGSTANIVNFFAVHSWYVWSINKKDSKNFWFEKKLRFKNSTDKDFQVQIS